MGKRYILLVPFFIMIVLQVSAGATPQLGVIDTDLLATSGGTVPVGMDGFLFPSDGRITVWWGNDAGNINLDADIWIVTNAGPGRTFAVGSSTYTLNTPISGTSDSGNIDGYPQPYYGFNLGSYNDHLVPWVQADGTTAPDLTGGNKLFYLVNGVFGGSLGGENWIFAIADMNDYGVIFQNGNDLFSPKTTSTVVPEPATLLLLGSGLIGLGLLGRRKFRTKP